MTQDDGRSWLCDSLNLEDRRQPQRRALDNDYVHALIRHRHFLCSAEDEPWDWLATLWAKRPDRADVEIPSHTMPTLASDVQHDGTRAGCANRQVLRRERI
jgi:hypothetical protein